MLINGRELAGLRKEAEVSMLDTVQIGTPVYPDGPGSTPDYYEYGADVNAGVQMDNPSQRGEPERHIPEDGLKIRLPIDITVTTENRIKVVRRHGSALEVPVECYVLGDPQRGISAQVVIVRKVNENEVV